MVSEIQRIFAYMMFSTYRYINPCAILNSLHTKDAVPIQIGNQEDITEFNNLLLQRTEEGLYALANKEEELSSNASVVKKCVCLCFNK